MRNLKRVLSLALALVMVLGMMVIGTSAATYADADEIAYTEAVDVMSALGVLEGDGTNYNPKDILTREQAAKIIAYMLLGEDKADKLAGSGVFTDVAATRWSAGYIDYCASLDILAGNGDGTYNPTGKLTGVAFAKMLLIALGYDAKVEGYVNNANWATNISSDAIDIGLDVKGVLLADEVSREVAAQMALQALECNMVKYETKGTTITVNGIEIVSGASAAEAVKRTETESGTNYAGDAATDAGYGYLQFCEKYFADLTKGTGTEAFGRPVSHVWAVDTIPVYTSVKTPVATYTGKTSPVQLAKDLGAYKFGGNKINNVTELGSNVTVDDQTITAGDTVVVGLLKMLAPGRLVEFYANPVTKEINEIVIVNYSTQEVKAIETDKKTGDVTYTITRTGASPADYVDYADADLAALDQIAPYAGIKKGDIVTVVTADGKLYVYPTTSFVGTQSANKSANYVTTLTIDGNAYTVSSAASGSFANSAIPNTYYVDQYGYVVLTTAITSESTDYLQIMDIDVVTKTVLGNKSHTVTARVLLADGTVAVYDLPVTTVGGTKVAGLAATITDNTSVNVISAGDVFGYTIVDGKLGLEAKTELSTTALTAAASGAVYKDSSVDLSKNAEAVGGNNVLKTTETVFVIYNADKQTATTVTGYKNLPTLSDTSDIVAVVKAGFGDDAYNTAAKVVFITVANADDISVADTKNLVYIVASDVSVVGVAPNTQYVYDAYAVDGSEVQVAKKGSAVADGDNLYYLNTDGTVGGVVSGNASIIAAAELTVSNNMVKSGSTWYNMTDATKIVYVDDELDVVSGNMGVIVLNPVSLGGTVATIFVVGAGS